MSLREDIAALIASGTVIPTESAALMGGATDTYAPLESKVAARSISSIPGTMLPRSELGVPVAYKPHEPNKKLQIWDLTSKAHLSLDLSGLTPAESREIYEEVEKAAAAHGITGQIQLAPYAIRATEAFLAQKAAKAQAVVAPPAAPVAVTPRTLSAMASVASPRSTAVPLGARAVSPLATVPAPLAPPPAVSPPIAAAPVVAVAPALPAVEPVQLIRATVGIDGLGELHTLWHTIVDDPQRNLLSLQVDERNDVTNWSPDQVAVPFRLRIDGSSEVLMVQSTGIVQHVGHIRVHTLIILSRQEAQHD